MFQSRSNFILNGHSQIGGGQSRLIIFLWRTIAHQPEQQCNNRQICLSAPQRLQSGRPLSDDTGLDKRKSDHGGGLMFWQLDQVCRKPLMCLPCCQFADDGVPNTKLQQKRRKLS
nr:hypothetical protein [Marinicella sp. W31]MDC2878610.1 hypothetical protein [Marinicella sp. W31]